MTATMVDLSTNPDTESSAIEPHELKIVFSDAAPAQLAWLASLGDHRFRFTAAIPISVNFEDDNFVVRWEEAQEFGYGPTISAALRDLQLTIVELHDELSNASAAEVSSDLSELRRLLKQHFFAVA